MSTVLVFSAPSSLDASVLGDEITFSWAAPQKLYPFVNAGGESGNVSGDPSGPPVGWSNLEGGMRVRVDEPSRAPPEGLNIFDGGTSPLSRASQRFSPLAEGLLISQIDTDALDITVNWFGGAFVQTPADQPQLHIHFLDEDQVLISTHSSGYKSPSTTFGTMRWDSYQEVVEIPVGTRFIDIEMDSLRNAGTNNDAAFDGIEFLLEDAEADLFVPGYAVYVDGVLTATVGANVLQAVLSGFSPGVYDLQVRAYDGVNFLSDLSAVYQVTVPEAQALSVIGFDDEYFPALGLFPRVNLRDKVCAYRPGSGKRPSSPAMIKSVCTKVKP